ncbi:MAG: MerR family transcriptional regulator [Blautia sp.]
MSETSYSVSEASDFLEVQSHVLRYWEEELSLPIQRNEMGHRYYTRWDIQVILSIKELKKKGYALREIKKLIPLIYEELRLTGTREKSSEKKPKNQRTGKRRKAQKAARAKEERRKTELNKQEQHPIPEEFMEILDRLVKERMLRMEPDEMRCRRLDEKIRICQKSRKEVAAAIERDKQEKHHGLFRKKRVRK